jgi:glucose-1-phosphate cytidylyltransferase
VKAVILAGGRGTRLGEETALRPKPMVEIGDRPILWHVMSIYARAGVTDFLVACGYRGEVIKRYFRDYALETGDCRIDLGTGRQEVLRGGRVEWTVTLIDTGRDTMTGGRIRRLAPWLGNTTFLATYGDGLADLDVRELLAFHRRHGRLATVTAVRPPSRFGGLALEGDEVQEFSEKPQAGEGWINGGFFVFEPGVLGYLEDDATVLEHEPLERLAREGQLRAFRHAGFWQPMDTLRDRDALEALWAGGRAPWIGP